MGRQYGTFKKESLCNMGLHFANMG